MQRKSCVTFFKKWKFSLKNGAYQPMNMNPYVGFRKAVNFKSFFFQLFTCCTKNALKWKNINKYDVCENHSSCYYLVHTLIIEGKC
jgi:hypothetical protein